MKYISKVPKITSNYAKSLLEYRGIKDVQSFLNPTAENLQDWRDLENMGRGVDFILSLNNLPNPRIALIVDCDVDGYTSAAIFYLYVKRAMPNITIDYYIHTAKQHGLEDMYNSILDSRNLYDAVIVPDGGTNDFTYIEELKTVNIPVLILDHHLLEETSPISDNCILINNQTSPNYKNKNLSGAGVVYQFCRALDSALNLNYADDYMDLAALGIDADLMSALEIENQYLWKKGFSQVNNYFFLTLARKQGYSITGKSGPSDEEIIEALNPISVGFYIAPLINAMIRSGSYEEKVRMFVAFIDGHCMIPSKKRGAKGTLDEVAVESARECGNAKAHQDKAKREATAAIETKAIKHELFDNQILFIRLDDEDQFPAELNGLIAMQLSDKYNKPTLIGRLNEDGWIRGSARGCAHSELEDLKTYLNNTKLFEYTAGHENAFGFSIHKSNLDKLHSLANSDLAGLNIGETCYNADFVRNANEKDIEDIIYDVSKFKSIWGTQNPEPLIAVNNIFVEPKDITIMGKNKDTIKIQKNGITYIKFFAKDLIQDLMQFNDTIKFTIVGKMNLNEWNGIYTPQILISDLDYKDAALEF